MIPGLLFTEATRSRRWVTLASQEEAGRASPVRMTTRGADEDPAVNETDKGVFGSVSRYTRHGAGMLVVDMCWVVVLS